MFGAGTPDHAGRNQRERAAALGQVSSPSMGWVARRLWAQYAPPTWGPGARPLARGVSGGVRTPPDKTGGVRGGSPARGGAYLRTKNTNSFVNSSVW